MPKQSGKSGGKQTTVLVGSLLHEPSEHVKISHRFALQVVPSVPQHSLHVPSQQMSPSPHAGTQGTPVVVVVGPEVVVVGASVVVVPDGMVVVVVGASVVVVPGGMVVVVAGASVVVVAEA